MFNIHKKMVFNDQGIPVDVIIPFKEYQEIEELLGLDLSVKELSDLRKAQKDRENNKRSAYINLDTI